MAAEQATRASGQPREPLSVRIHRDLAERIARGEFAAGAQLPTEKELSENYGVSRAVVREAITILRADGLVLVRQGAGVFSLGIRPVPYTGRHPDFSSVTDAIETLELRLSIECEAAALAATRGNQIRAAELLGLNRNTLRKKIRELDMQVVRSPR